MWVAKLQWVPGNLCNEQFVLEGRYLGHETVFVCCIHWTFLRWNYSANFLYVGFKVAMGPWQFMQWTICAWSQISWAWDCLCMLYTLGILEMKLLSQFFVTGLQSCNGSLAVYAMNNSWTIMLYEICLIDQQRWTKWQWKTWGLEGGFALVKYRYRSSWSIFKECSGGILHLVNLQLESTRMGNILPCLLRSFFVDEWWRFAQLDSTERFTGSFTVWMKF